MKLLQPDHIPQLDAHDDAETLRGYDHPDESLRRWVGVLTAKAWAGANLVCFFTDAEHGAMRILLVFKASQGFMPRFDGPDMREASIGSRYKLDVFVATAHPPIIDKVEPL